MSMIFHETVHFSGHVQGVGFRYTTRQVAKEFEVTGAVENLADGRVKLEVEGQGAEIDAFVQAVQERLEGYIRQVERGRDTNVSHARDFVIR